VDHISLDYRKTALGIVQGGLYEGVEADLSYFFDFFLAFLAFFFLPGIIFLTAFLAFLAIDLAAPTTRFVTDFFFFAFLAMLTP
jgi:hypothetical protein